MPEIVRSRLRPGRELIPGIRPEHARLAADEPPAFKGRAVHIEHDLPRRVQTLLVEFSPLPEIAVTIYSSEAILPRDWVPVVLNPDKLVFFDGRTELRIG